MEYPDADIFAALGGVADPGPPREPGSCAMNEMSLQPEPVSPGAPASPGSPVTMPPPAVTHKAPWRQRALKAGPCKAKKSESNSMKCLRRVMNGHARDGSPLVSEEIRKAWNDLDNGGRDSIIQLWEQSNQKRD